MPNGFIHPRGGAGGSLGSSAAPGKRLRMQLLEDERRAAIREVGERRRAEVYRTDVVFSGEEASIPLPEPGLERDRLVAALRQLRSEGVSQLRIAERLGIDVSQVRYLCDRHKIRKGE